MIADDALIKRKGDLAMKNTPKDPMPPNDGGTKKSRRERFYCPLCGQELTKDPICPHTLEFGGYLFLTEMAWGCHLSEKDDMWIQLGHTCSLLLSEIEIAEGVTRLPKAVPRHLRGILDVKELKWDRFGLDQYVDGIIVSLPGFAGAVSFETETGDTCSVFSFQDPKRTMELLNERLAPDVAAMKRAIAEVAGTAE